MIEMFSIAVAGLYDPFTSPIHQAGAGDQLAGLGLAGQRAGADQLWGGALFPGD
jgi:hypothetical protein